MIEQTSSTIYHRDVHSLSIQLAERAREDLKTLGIESPDTSKLHPLKTNENTIFFFKSKAKRDRFLKKYYNKTTNKYQIGISFFDSNNQ